MKIDVQAHKLVRALRKHGFEPAKSNGGHQKYKHADGRSIAVPHNRVIKGSFILSMIKQGQLNKENFLAALD